MAKDKLIGRKRYTLMYNCKPIFTEDGEQFEMTGMSIMRKLPSYELDLRTEMVSIYNTYDIKEYYQYYSLYITTINSINTDLSLNNILTGHLDMGYIPIYCPPTFYSKENSKIPVIMQSMFDKCRIKGEKLEMLKVQPIRLDGTLASSYMTDVWLSRFQMSSVLNCRPETIRAFDVLNCVMKGGK